MYKTLLIFFISLHAYAQQGIIKGTAIAHNTRKGVEFATVSLLSARDSSIIKSTFTDAIGAFEISLVPEGVYLLAVSSVEYEKIYKGPVTISPAQLISDLGEVAMQVSQKTLGEVRVTGQAPLFSNKANGTVEVNVANTLLATSTSPIEILSRSPGVNVTEDGIFVPGKGEAIIYLNGRRITTEQFASISASQIKKMEIIANPSSRYDAEGKAVINVITITNADEGYKGNIRQVFTASDFSPPSGNTNLDVNYKKDKLSLTGSYGLLLGRTREILNTTRSRLKSADLFQSVLMTDWNRRYDNFSNYNFGGQYDLNKKSYISAEYSGSYNQLGGNTQSENAITSATMNGLFKSDVSNNNIVRNNALTFNYSLTPDNKGSSLFVGGQYAGYVSDTDDDIREKNLVGGLASSRLLNNKAGYNIRLTNIQADYSRAIHQYHKLDFGVKYSNAHNSSYSDFYAGVEGKDLVPDNTRSADFKYLENIPAAYLSLNSEMDKKLSYTLGLRSEWTSYTLQTDVKGFEMIRDNYLNLFPNAQVSLKPSDQFQLSLSYTSRITRPRYQALNPSGIYQDAYTSIEGNPFLKPEKTNAFEIGATYDKYYLKAGYSHTKDAISGAAVQGEAENSYVLKPMNFSRLNAWYVSLSAPFTLSWWNSMNTVDIIYNKYTSDDFSFVLRASRPQLNLYSGNTFNISNLFKIQAIGRYNGDKYDGIFYRHNQLMAAMGIEKDFFDKTLKVNLMANDIFRLDKPSGHYEIGQTYIDFARKNNNKYYRITLTYSFGQLKKVNYKNRSTGQAENSRAL